MWRSSFSRCHQTYLGLYDYVCLVSSLYWLKLQSTNLDSKVKQNVKVKSISVFGTIYLIRCFVGTLIRRHRIPKPAPRDDEYYTAEDFNINCEINLYSKTFKITDSDDFTKNFLKKMGVRVNQPSDGPENPYTKYRKAVSLMLTLLLLFEKCEYLYLRCLVSI